MGPGRHTSLEELPTEDLEEVVDGGGECEDEEVTMRQVKLCLSTQSRSGTSDSTSLPEEVPRDRYS